jgi:hypothetical protein
MAQSGTNIYVVNDDFNAPVSEYTTTGQVVNLQFIPNVVFGTAILISGTNLYLANSSSTTGVIAQYNLSGAVINSHLLSVSGIPTAMAISGTNLFVVHGNYVGSYTTSGKTNNDQMIPGVNQAFGIAVDGTNLFVDQTSGGGSIGEYTLTGTPINQNFIVGVPSEATGFVISNHHFFVVSQNKSVGEYAIDGTVINPVLFSLPSTNLGYIAEPILILPETGLPGPTALTETLGAAGTALSWPTNAFAYQLETSATLNPSSWTVVTNLPAVTNGNFSVNVSPTNAAQYFRLDSID